MKKTNYIEPTNGEYDEHALEFFENLATKTYTPKKLAKMHARGDGSGMRKFLGWYHLFIFELEKVPQHWLIFTTNLLMNAAYITENDPKARQGLLAKNMGLQGGKSMELRDFAISVTIQQYRNKSSKPKIKVACAIDRTADRAITAGFALGYEGIDKIWRNRDKEETLDSAEAFPKIDFINLSARQYKRK